MNPSFESLIEEVAGVAVVDPDNLTTADRGFIVRSLAVELRRAFEAAWWPELMVCEHCLLTAEGVCATDATGQVRCRDCLRRRQVRYLVERDGTRLPVAIDACGRTRIFLS